MQTSVLLLFFRLCCMSASQTNWTPEHQNYKVGSRKHSSHTSRCKP